MKKFVLLGLFLLFILVGCNLSLAADITPPPDYRSPTPPPTLGPLYPAQPPDPQRGAAIYAEKCLACHGERGLGDGPQGKQLPVRVAALGLPEIARSVSPARWFTVVTQGNLERFMPPFMSLNAQERWDVVAYALTLHTSPQEVAEGEQIFSRLCSSCDRERFRNQEQMAALSNQDLFRWVTEGTSDFSALPGISEADAWKVVAYLRSLSFATPAATLTSPAETPTPAATLPTAEVGGTPATGAETPLSGSGAAGPTGTAAQPSSGQGVVSGEVVARGGAQLPSSLQVTLRGYDHDANTMPVETVTLSQSLDANGQYRFEGVELPAGRIFLAEVEVEGVRYVSPFVATEAGKAEVRLPAVEVYPLTEDFGLLRISQTHIQVNPGEGQVQVLTVYSIVNASEKTVVVRTDGTELPFLRFPQGAQQTGLQLSQDSAPLLEAQGGFAMPPSTDPYGIIAFYTLPYEKNRAEVRQPFALPSDSAILILPEGMEAKGPGLTDSGTRTFQGNVFHLYSAPAIAPGQTLTFTISGKPRATTSAVISPSSNLWIGVGVLGMALILLGAWFYWRERQAAGDTSEEAEDAPFESEEEVLDAILALDDLHRAGKLSEAAYQTRRAELKEQLEAMRRHD